MERVQAGDIKLGCHAWGSGPVAVVYIHGNLASKDWIAPCTPWLPDDLTVTAIDWRGCGDSDRPAPDPDHTNYSVEQHAADMMAALDTLGIERCHLATHSTGGLIAAHMQLTQPERFGRVLHLDPVPPAGLEFAPQAFEVFRAMQQSREMTRQVMAGVASSLFRPESFGMGHPAILPGLAQLGETFEKLIDQTVTAGDGIWMGTPLSLVHTRQTGGLQDRMGDLIHETVILWGAQDPVIPREEMDAMAAGLPNARLIVVPGIGHSMNIEAPQMYAGHLAQMFSGIAP